MFVQIDNNFECNGRTSLFLTNLDLFLWDYERFQCGNLTVVTFYRNRYLDNEATLKKVSENSSVTADTSS